MNSLLILGTTAVMMVITHLWLSHRHNLLESYRLSLIGSPPARFRKGTETMGKVSLRIFSEKSRCFEIPNKIIVKGHMPPHKMSLSSILPFEGIIMRLTTKDREVFEYPFSTGKSEIWLNSYIDTDIPESLKDSKVEFLRSNNQMKASPKVILVLEVLVLAGVYALAIY